MLPIGPAGQETEQGIKRGCAQEVEALNAEASADFRVAREQPREDRTPLRSLYSVRRKQRQSQTADLPKCASVPVLPLIAGKMLSCSDTLRSLC